MINVYKCRCNEDLEIPEISICGSLNLKTCFDLGDSIRTYNNWNKEVMIPAKTIAGSTAVQVHPDARVEIPTGLVLNVPDSHILKLYVQPEVALKRGLLLASGTQVITSADNDKELVITLYNITDSVIAVEHNEELAIARLEKTLKYTIQEINPK